MEKQNENKIEVEIIINGTSYGSQEFPENMKLIGLRSVVLSQNDNTGQPPENWEIKDENGNLLNLDKHLSDYEHLDQIWFSLKAGVGGNKFERNFG